MTTQTSRIQIAHRINSAANHREVWIRDPDGYLVVLASPTGDVG